MPAHTQAADDDDSPEPPLSMLTWNVAEFRPSDEAPAAWTGVDSQIELAQTLLDVQPAVLVLQEVPDGVDMEFEGYAHAPATAASHCGRVHLYVATERARLVGSAVCGPHVVASIDVVGRRHDSKRLTVVGGHLAPGPKAAADRRAQLAAALEAVLRDTDCRSLVWLGDANARDAETRALCAVAAPKMPLIDAYEQWASRAPEAEAQAQAQAHRFTWDSIRNRYHRDAHRFTCRFDRCMVTGDCACVGVRLLQGRTAKNFCLSDHYGLLVQIRVAR